MIKKVEVYSVGDKLIRGAFDAALEMLALKLSNNNNPTETTYTLAKTILDHAEDVREALAWLRNEQTHSAAEAPPTQETRSDAP